MKSGRLREAGSTSSASMRHEPDRIAPPSRLSPRMSVQRNVLANLVAGGWMGLLGLAMLPVYMHYLGVEAYGLIGFFATLQAWFLMLDLGLSPTLNREMARYSAGRLSA